jgi:hypothetical protein
MKYAIANTPEALSLEAEIWSGHGSTSLGSQHVIPATETGIESIPDNLRYGFVALGYCAVCELPLADHGILRWHTHDQLVCPQDFIARLWTPLQHSQLGGVESFMAIPKKQFLETYSPIEEE